MATDGKDPQSYDVVIVGAGLAGLATAIGLFERGITNIVVLEKARVLAPVGASIAVFENGLRALEHISPSVAERVRLSCVPVERLVVKDGEGNFLHEKKPHVKVNYMVWYLLQQYLKEGLPPGILRLGQRVDSFEAANDSGQDHATDECTMSELVTIHTTDVRDPCNDDGQSNSNTTSTIRATVLIAADGINSVIRSCLFAENTNQKLYHGKVSYRAVFQTSTLLNNNHDKVQHCDINDDSVICSQQQGVPPAGVNTTFQGEEPGKIFSYRETSPGWFTVTSMAPVEDPAEDYRAAKAGASMERFCKVFERFTAPEVQRILAATPDDSIRIDPIHDIDVLDRWSKGNVIVIGDAAHAMSPSMGQGANQSLEDASVLVHELERVLLRKSASPNGSGKVVSINSNSLRGALTKVWQSRVDRVKRIHAASRARSFTNNKTSKTKPVDLTSKELKELLTEMDSWRPPVDEDVHLGNDSMPSTFDILGAKLHGNYSSVLEFQSLPGALLQLRPNDILVRVFFVDVNPVDIQKLCGNINMVGRPVENPPHVPGYGGSGTAVEVGSAIREAGMAASWKGQSVCFFADPTRLGSYATHVVVDVNCIAKLPPLSPSSPWASANPGAIPISNRGASLTMMLRDCACIPVAGLTAYESLTKCGLVTSSESDNKSDIDGFIMSLLIVGAAGGVGSWTISLARALNPRLEIIATASSQAQHDWCISLGADRVIKHKEISSTLKGGREGSVDAVVCLAEPTEDLFGALSDVIKPYGTICLVVAGKSIGSLNLGFCFFKCVDVKTQTVFSSIRTKYRKITPARELEFIIGLLASGKMKSPLSPELGNKNVSESFRDALEKNGVLKALSEPTGRRGNFVMEIES